MAEIQVPGMRVTAGPMALLAKKWDVTIQNPQPTSTTTLMEIQGKTYSPDAAGVSAAINDTLKANLGDVPFDWATGSLQLSFTIGADGRVSEVRVDAFDETSGSPTLVMKEGKTLKQLAERIAGLLSNAHFSSPADGEPVEVRVPFQFSLSMR